MQINCRLEPDETAGFYELIIEFPHTNKSKSSGQIDLRPECRFPLQKPATSIQEMLDLLDHYNEREARSKLNASGMIDFGAFLFDSLFKKHPTQELFQESGDLRIISSCEHIHRLPWNLLAIGHEARFLREADWQITLAREYFDETVTLPALPSLLIFSPPELDGSGMTGRDAHIRQIKQALTDEIRTYESKAYLQVVDSRHELERILKQQHFDVLYYYGHGEGNASDSNLRIADDNGASPGTMSLMHLRNLLGRERDTVGGPPALCYINACMSSSGGKMGAGLQLGQVCTAVVANRTEAWVSVARRQGLDFLKQILLDGRSPHEALHNTVTYGDEDSGDLSWATPVLTRHYTDWHCERPPNLHHLDRQAKDWRTRLDRTKQSGLMGEYIEAVVEGSVDTLCCLWSGGLQSGVNLLHERVTHKVPDSIDLLSCQMAWDKAIPDDKRDEIFRSTLLSAFQCMHHIKPASIEAVPRMLRNIALRGGNRRILFHLRLQTVNPARKDWALPENFCHFLSWWQRVVCPEFQRAGIAVIITMGYELERSDILEKRYTKYLKTLNTQQLMIRLLPPLEAITQDHMRDFIQIFKLPIPTRIIDREVGRIEQNAQGDYQQSLSGLINLYEHGAAVTAIPDTDFDDEDEELY